jgi:hypothetical protein
MAEHPLTRLARELARLERILEAERRSKMRRGAPRLLLAVRRSYVTRSTG